MNYEGIFLFESVRKLRGANRKFCKLAAQLQVFQMIHSAGGFISICIYQFEVPGSNSRRLDGKHEH